jgi:hypothetical protein
LCALQVRAGRVTSSPRAGYQFGLIAPQRGVAKMGCGDRFPNRERVHVGDGNLTFFEGDSLCEECAGNHGVL